MENQESVRFHVFTNVYIILLVPIFQDPDGIRRASSLLKDVSGKDEGEDPEASGESSWITVQT